MVQEDGHGPSVAVLVVGGAVALAMLALLAILLF